MKTKLSILILLISKICSAQLQEIQLSTSVNINSLVYTNPYLFINGNENYLAKLNITTNNITQLTPIENSPFYTYSLNIIDTNSFWGIAGRASPFSDYIIKHSSDGGQSWQNSSDTFSVGLNDLKMISDTVGYGVGLLGTFYDFNSFNQVWDSLNIDYQYQNLVVNTYSDSLIVIASIGFVHTSHNRGLNWTTKSIYDIPSCIYFQNKDTFFLTTNYPSDDEASIFTTVNSGNNWTISLTTQNFSLNSVAFFNSEQGIAVGANKILNKGAIFFTNDAGLTWTNSSTQYDTEFIKTLIINDSTVFISGTNGKLYKTNKNLLLNTATNNIETIASPIIYPNPAKDILNIKLENTQKISTSIFDVFGNEINLYSNQTNNTIIYNTQSLKQGLYFLKVSTQYQLTFHKFQIIR